MPTLTIPIDTDLGDERHDMILTMMMMMKMSVTMMMLMRTKMMMRIDKSVASCNYNGWSTEHDCRVY